jgi:hypothetical protein
MLLELIFPISVLVAIGPWTGAFCIIVHNVIKKDMQDIDECYNNATK